MIQIALGFSIILLIVWSVFSLLITAYSFSDEYDKHEEVIIVMLARITISVEFVFILLWIFYVIGINILGPNK